MKQIYKWLTSIKNSLKKVKLIDKCLIIFMILLMSQSIYNLFVHQANSNLTGSIDILIRTTAASIFGYFLSVNFVKKDNNRSEKIDRLDKNLIQKHSLTVSDSLKERIEKNLDMPEDGIDSIDDNNDEKDIHSKDHLNDVDDNNETSEQQVVIVTIIGIVALVVIIVVRNSDIATTNSYASISQLRDFVSGSVGFLLGCPTKNNK